MDTAVGLVQAYLRVNGYFTVAEYPVLDATGPGGPRTITDLDILAVRLHRAPGASGTVDAPLDPALGAGGGADMIVGEVKEWAVSSFVDDLFVDFRPRLRSGRSRRPGSRRGCDSRGWSAAGGGCRTPLCTASRRISLAAGSRRTAGSTSRS